MYFKTKGVLYKVSLLLGFDRSRVDVLRQTFIIYKRLKEDREK